MSIHFFLRDELREAVLDCFARARGKGQIGLGFEIYEMKLVIANGGYCTAVRRKTGINPALSRKFSHTGIRACNQIEFTGKSDQQFAAIFRQVKASKTAQALAFAFSPAPF